MNTVRTRPHDTDDAEGLRLYLDQVGRESLLTADDEVELARAIEQGREAEETLERSPRIAVKRRAAQQRAVEDGRRARHRFIRANLRLVVSIAKRYQGQGLTLLDLIQEGSIGLIRAVEKFDWRRGFKFSTYATWWIRQAIQRGVADKAHAIRIPVHTAEEVRRIERHLRTLSQSLGRDPTDAEIARAARMSHTKVEELLGWSRMRRLTSLQKPVAEDGENLLLDLIPDPAGEAAFDAIDESLVRSDLGDAMGQNLDEREAIVITLRFGLADGEPRSLQEIGERLQLSRERVRQIERDALAKLREDGRLSA